MGECSHGENGGGSGTWFYIQDEIGKKRGGGENTIRINPRIKKQLEQITGFRSLFTNTQTEEM